MPRRSVDNDEIGLIKAMLARGIRNRDIQFYFNRQDRPVNSGRITQIRQATYGPEVPEASQAELDAFLARFEHGQIGVVVEVSAEPERRSVADEARARFEYRDDGHWYLADGETSEQECKIGFDPRRLTGIIKAIAGLANNRGGFIFIGVSDDGHRVAGLQDDAFSDTDIARITDQVKTYLTPTPIFSKHIIGLGQFFVGVLRVEKQAVRPVIVVRDGNGLNDGSVLFRYPGQSSQIKFGDLLELLRERDRAAQAILLARAERLSTIGTDKALIVDAQSGTMDAGHAQITIDRELAEQLEFIREGEFEEQQGAATLRLVGDVRAVDEAGAVRERVEGRPITADSAIKAFLRREQVRSPMAYVEASAQVQRLWLPLFYFLHLAGTGRADAIQLLENTPPVYRTSKSRALQRLRNERSAFLPLTGVTAPVAEEIAQGNLEGIVERHRPDLIARAIQTLPNTFRDVAPLHGILDTLHDAYLNDTSVRGALYRATCRLDEIEFGG